MANIKKSLRKFWSKIKSRNTYRSVYSKTTNFIKRKPFASFFIVLFLLFAMILLGNIFSAPKSEKPAENTAKEASLFSIGKAPLTTYQAKIDKPGVIKIVALSSGVIQSINVSEGDNVYRGQQLFYLSTNYQGGNAPAIQAQIANLQYKNVLDTFDTQNELIQKQRDIANINRDNFTEMQNIATQSANDTNNLINSNQSIIDTLNQILTDSSNSGASPSAIISQQMVINQLQAGQNQLKTSLANLKEQTDSSKPAGRLADAQHDLTMNQLEIQEKSLLLNKEVSQLQADLSDVYSAQMCPSSPFEARVEKVYVRIGQQVNPGTILAEISATDPKTQAIIDVPETIARNMSLFSESKLHLNGKTYSIKPSFISSEATNGSLFEIYYSIPDNQVNNISDGEYITIDVPVGQIDTSASVPFIPLDAIYQTQDSNYVLLSKKNVAVSQKISIGEVYGSFAEITKGLHSGDLVILNRNIIAGDKIK